jgi:hypothetical protein
VGAGDEHIGVELIDINDISVLIGVEFWLKLEWTLDRRIFVL